MSMASSVGANASRAKTPSTAPKPPRPPWLVLRDYLWPLIKGKDLYIPPPIFLDLLSHVRGHNMAKGALESAVWDAEARMKNIPLWKLLGGTQQEINSGVSIGLKVSLEVLVEAVKKELDAGYQRIKIKIKPGQDLELVRRLRQDFPRIKLMVDANSAYRLEDWPHAETARRLLPDDDRAAAGMGRPVSATSSCRKNSTLRSASTSASTPKSTL